MEESSTPGTAVHADLTPPGPREEPIELSVIVPIYNEQEAIPHFFDRIVPVLAAITGSYEIICVNDGSSDASLASLQQFRSTNDRIRIIDLTRNFGKEVALSAGIDFCRGQAVIPIDADLQDPPELIHELVDRWRKGYDIVLAAREDRSSDSLLKRVSADLFYRAMSKVSDTSIPPNVGDFRLMSRPVIEAIRKLPERTRFMKGIFAWVGYRQTTVYYTRPPRAAGTTKWRMWPLWNFALEGIVSFSTIPLKIWSYIGFTAAMTGLAYMIFIVARTLVTGVDVPGYASLLSFVLFFNGLVLAGLGVIGEYVARIFVEVKQRPLYLVRETWGMTATGADDRP